MSDSEPSIDPALSEYVTDEDSDYMDYPAPTLPAGVKKETLVHSSGTMLKRPQEGDEVAINYLGSRPDGSLLHASNEKGGPFRFLVGKGQVMRGWDVAVATMRLYERAKFTFSPKFAVSPGEVPNLAAVYEIELVDWIARFDLLGDGTVIKNTLKRHEDSRRSDPKEVCDLRYRCMLGQSGQVLKELERLEFALDCNDTQGDGLISTDLLDRAVKTMRRGEVASLNCAASVAYGSDRKLPEGLGPDAQICCELELRDFVRTDDISFEKDKTVIMRSLHRRDAWPACRDAGRCTLKVASVKDGDELILADKTLEFTIGNGEVCDALECMAASMKHHEVARVTCKSAELCEESRLGLVPGRAGLVFEVEVVDYQPGPCEEAKRDAEKIEYVEARKAIAGQLVQAKRYALAAFIYLKSYELLGYVDDFRNMRSGEERKAKISELKKLCMLNRTLCLVKAGQYRKAVKACDLVLEVDPRNAKALFRRAQAHLSLGNTREAMRSVRVAVETEPHNRQARKLYSEVKATLQADDTGATDMYAKMCDGLGKLPHPLDVD